MTFLPITKQANLRNIWDVGSGWDISRIINSACNNNFNFVQPISIEIVRKSNAMHL